MRNELKLFDNQTMREDKDLYIRNLGNHTYLYVPIGCTWCRSYEVVRFVCKKNKK